jgi:hypothetical protein
LQTDSPDLTDGPDNPSTADRLALLRSRVAKALPVLLGGLVLGTSVAVAFVSWWLVAPYLVLIGFLLYEPAGRRVNATNPAGPESDMSSGNNTLVDPTDPADDAGSGDLRGGTTATTKGRRAARKTKKARNVVEPAPATWLQVAPGKFVRVEPGAYPAGHGPHPPQTEVAPQSLPLGAQEEGAPSEVDPGRPPADPGTQDAPTEDALDAAHPETTPPDGPAPDGLRDPDDARAGTTRDDVPRTDAPSLSFDRSISAGSQPVADARPHLAFKADVTAALGRSPGTIVSEAPDARVDAGRSDETPTRADEGFTTDVDARERAGSGMPAEEPESNLVHDLHANAEGIEPEAEATDHVDVEDNGPWDEQAVDVEDESGDFEEGDESPESYCLASGTSYRRDGHQARTDAGAPPPRRNVRSFRVDRRPPGLRLRSRRSIGRPRQFVRTFPPRSPPWPRLVCALNLDANDSGRAGLPSTGACPARRLFVSGRLGWNSFASAIRRDEGEEHEHIGREDGDQGQALAPLQVYRRRI